MWTTQRIWHRSIMVDAMFSGVGVRALATSNPNATGGTCAPRDPSSVAPASDEQITS
jgi:hypothetical protein